MTTITLTTDQTARLIEAVEFRLEKMEQAPFSRFLQSDIENTRSLLLNLKQQTTLSDDERKEQDLIRRGL